MIKLIDYGYLEKHSISGELIPARVTEVHRSSYKIICEHGEKSASLKGSLLGKTAQPQDFPAVGDFVLIRYNDGQPIICEVLPRKSKFSRPDYSGHAAGYVKTILEQVVAANFDYVFIMCSLNLDFNVARIQRYIAASWQSGGTPVIVLTKSDLCEDYSAQLLSVQKAAAGVDIAAVSAKTGEGLDKLSPYLGYGKTIVFLGSSGVGKSSLVNVLAGEDIMKIKDIREDDSRGRHTTTHRQLIKLSDGTMIIDTPGMRELSLWDASEGVGELFSDVEDLFARCKFSNCRHETEPGCGIKAAIESGKLSLKRWQDYIKLKDESRFTDDKAAYLRGKKQRHKDLAKWSRQRSQVPKTDFRNSPCAESFTCTVCGSPVASDGAGSQHRNHCPNCLTSVHVDDEPGDRASLCKGVMDAIGVWVRKNGEWAIIHRCRSCGELSSNRIAADDNQTLLMSIAVKPLALPPFPLGGIEQRLAPSSEV